MPKALECPRCGQRHPVDELPDAPTFVCAGCGRKLKLPARAGVGAGRDGTDTGADTVGGAPARPRRRSATSGPRPGGTATAPPESVRSSTKVTPRTSRPERSAPRKSPLWFRVLSWFLAVPLGAMLVIGGANVFGLLTGSQLTDMFLQARFGAYTRLLIALPVWALVTALLVHVADLLWRSRLRRRQRADDG